MERARATALVLAAIALIVSPCAVTVAQTTAAADSLTEQLRSPRPEVRRKAARKLGRRADLADLPALASALTDPEVKVRREVIIALAQYSTPESLRALASATRDPDAEVRMLAVQAVVGYYTGQTPASGFKVAMKTTWKATGGRLGKEEDVVIDPGVPVEPRATSALIDALKDENSIRAARESANGLGLLLARPAVPHLIQSAHSEDERLARESLRALVRICDVSAGPKLIDLLDTGTQDVKREVAVTVGVLRAQEALPKLQALFENDPSNKTRKKAFQGLANLGSPVSLPLFIKTLWSGDKTLRLLAAEGLARAGDAKGLPELERVVAVERDASVRVAMQYGITALGKHDYLSTLVDSLKSTALHDRVQTYLVELSHDPKFLPKLYPYLLRREAKVRARLCTVLMYTGDKSSWEHLDRLARDPNPDVAAEALRAMHAVRAREALPTSPLPSKVTP